MLTEYEVQLCLIRGKEEPSGFLQAAERELKLLFPTENIRELQYKASEEAEIILAEIEGKNRYRSEEELVDHLRIEGSELFWTWLQGYRMLVDEKDASCGCCKLKQH